MTALPETYQDRLRQVYGGVMTQKRQPWDTIGKSTLATAQLVANRQTDADGNQARSILRHQMGMYGDGDSAEEDKIGGDAV